MIKNTQVIAFIKRNSFLYSLGRICKNVNLFIIYPLSIVMDLYTIPHNCPNIPLYKRISNAFKYRIASIRFSISKIEKLISSYHNIYKEKRCFIIGNGPSLNKLDLTKLKDEFTFGVNAIYTNYDKMGFLPVYFLFCETSRIAPTVDMIFDETIANGEKIEWIKKW